MKKFEQKRTCKSVRLVYFICKLIEEKEIKQVEIITAYAMSFFNVAKNTVIKSLRLLEQEQMIVSIEYLGDTRKRVVLPIFE